MLCLHLLYKNCLRARIFYAKFVDSVKKVCRLMQANFSLPQKIGTFQSWFEVYKVSKGTFAICESKHWEGVISYLIEGRNKAVLVDTGMGIGDIKEVVEQLTRLDPKAYRILASKPTYLLKHEEMFDLGDRNLKVLHTPGHSPGSICLLDTKSRELFTGDTFYLSSLLAHFPESDFLAYSRTADYLASLEPSISVLRPSHDDSRRQPFAESEFLVRLAKAYQSIKTEEANFSPRVCPYTGVKIRDYRFEGFSIWVKEDLESQR
jgi:glyoxylase-like metal-dependent hydrolase (beta-lactamase superfamily II)